MANQIEGKRISFESFKKATTQQLLSIIKDESCPRYEKCRANTELTRRFQAGTLSFSSGESA
jgi:hypothetical protein